MPRPDRRWLFLAAVIGALVPRAGWAAQGGLRLHGDVAPASAPVKTGVEAVLSGPDVARIQDGSSVFIVPADVATEVRTPTDPYLVAVAASAAPGRAQAPGVPHRLYIMPVMGD